MNTLELKKHSSGAFETCIYCDGVTLWELHPERKTEIDILKFIRDKKYYQDFIGRWSLTLLDDNELFTNEKFDIVIQLAIAFIQTRDHPTMEDDYV